MTSPTQAQREAQRTLQDCPFCKRIVFANSVHGYPVVSHADDSECLLRKLTFVRELWDKFNPPKNPVSEADVYSMVIAEGCIREALAILIQGHPGHIKKAIAALEKSGIRYVGGGGFEQATPQSPAPADVISDARNVFIEGFQHGWGDDFSQEGLQLAMKAWDNSESRSQIEATAAGVNPKLVKLAGEYLNGLSDRCNPRKPPVAAAGAALPEGLREKLLAEAVKCANYQQILATLGDRLSVVDWEAPGKLLAALTPFLDSAQPKREGQ